MTRFLVVQHEDNAGPGRLGRRWEEAGVELQVVRAWREPVPSSLRDVDALVVLGGSMSATSDPDHPWLTPTKARLREAVEQDVPVLGLCLGHQLLAVALGGEVAPRGTTTFGLTPFLRGEAGWTDPLLASLAEPVVVVHYNDDHVVRAPAGAVALAHAPDGQVSAARYAPRAWGFQCHPEVDAGGFAAWTVDKPREAQPSMPVPLADHATAVRLAEPALESQWGPLAAAFLAQVVPALG